MASRQPLLILATLALSSCNNGTDAFCTATKPIIPDERDVLSDGTMRAIIVNDDARQKLCGRFDGHQLFDMLLEK